MGGNLKEVDLLRSEAERWEGLRAEELKILNEASMAESRALRLRTKRDEFDVGKWGAMAVCRSQPSK